MKLILTFLLCFFSSLATIQSQADTLIVVLIADRDSRKDFEVDYDKWTTFFRQLAKKNKLYLDTTAYFVGSRFAKDSILQALPDLKRRISPNTRVALCVSTHGIISSDKKDEYPDICFSENQITAQNLLSYSFLFEELQAQKPLFLFGLADMCNSEQQTGITLGDRSPFPNERFIVSSQVEDLFMKSQGYIKLTASSKGEEAKSTARHGGICTYHFFQNLEKHAKTASNQTPSQRWGAVLEGLKIDVQKMLDESAGGSKYKQTPVYEGFINGKDVSDGSGGTDDMIANIFLKNTEDKIKDYTALIVMVSNKEVSDFQKDNLINSIHQNFFDNKDVTTQISSLSRPTPRTRDITTYLKSLKKLIDKKSPTYHTIKMQMQIIDQTPIKEIKHGKLWKASYTFRQVFIGYDVFRKVVYQDECDKEVDIFVEQTTGGDYKIYLGNTRILDTRPLGNDLGNYKNQYSKNKIN
ncbi:MAG: hypothetical protein JJT94_05435 [Bernardetiaceae bacterium]|nr:hypothetical protein [Bernardetiaceae bacterium]